MKTVTIKNISLRTGDAGGYTHLLFTDEAGCTRLGRILPFPVNGSTLKSIWKRAGRAGGVLVPDALTMLPDGTGCISVDMKNRSPADGVFSLDEILKPVQELNLLGLNHLSIDCNSYLVKENRDLELIYWGDGLARVHPAAPPEVAAGGFPDLLSDLYMASSTALSSGWLNDGNEMKQAEVLAGNDYAARCSAAEQFGYAGSISSRVFDGGEYFRFSVLRGGTWQNRDAQVNSLLCEANSRGWACRAVRKASGERGRPLPDIAAGSVTTSPEQLLSNVFHNRPGIEKLLVICDLSEGQEDLVRILKRLRKAVPSGLHILVCTSGNSLFRNEREIALSGTATEALDLPLSAIEGIGECCCTGPSWYGPRCRADFQLAANILEPVFTDETLFREGAWLRTVSAVSAPLSAAKAESLLKLGRFREALNCVPEESGELKAAILIRLGRHREALGILSEDSDPLLLASALRGAGEIRKALEVLKRSGKSEHLPELAGLYDLCGIPSAGLHPLLEGLEQAEGARKVSILCALRNLEMRMGLYSDALEHAEMAVKISMEISGISQLINGLQARGRTLLVLGRWREALEDFETAVNLHDENAILSKRPPHIDLFDLQLRMGLVAQAESTLAALEKITQEGDIPSEQMLLMLKANMSALLGDGEAGISTALKAEELASSHGMELYSGISTLYAGKLYIQAGMEERGFALLRKARAKGHMLGDRHLVCLADIELSLGNSEAEGFQDLEYTGGKELSEEYLIASILRGREREESFRKLVEFPSPLTAGRLAETCGFPASEETAGKIIASRERIALQLAPERRERYLALFPHSRTGIGSGKMSPEESEEILRAVSDWIADYGEGLTGPDALKERLGLSAVSLVEDPSMVRVPGRNPMFITGRNARAIAPFLSSAAAVLSCMPGRMDRTESHARPGDIQGESSSMQKIRHEIERYAGEEISVLITGETGTGKEICARAIHRLSERSAEAFVPVDCGAIPENLMESELFGAAAGAYTGITTHRNGLLQEADRGTLFLDEVGNLPLHMQAKLLRVLDAGVFRKLGENRERRVNLRIIAATNADLRDQMARGLFRSDLFYRLAVVEIHLPALRDRLSDLEVLARHFTGMDLSPGALSMLKTRSWPGNVRELQNVVRRAAISASGGVIRSCDIASEDHVWNAEAGLSLHEAVRKHIVRTVAAAGGNRSEAAKILKCDPKTVRKYLKSDRL